MAYGTESVRPVDVIVGPGNAYVAVAKRLVAGEGRVGVPSAFAGPSEVVVIADASVDTDLVAVDVILQAEHGPGGLAWLVTWDEAVADAVVDQITAQVEASPRRADIESTFAEGGYAVVVDGPEQALEVANLIAPEHLELLCHDPASLVPGVRHAGAVFCGPWAPASVGDYIAGPSHVLPTDGSARFGPALTVSRLHQARARHHPRPRGAPRGRPARRGAGHRRGPRRPRRLDPPAQGACAVTGRGTTERLAPRDDVALMEGYHSPQVDVAVRLNTNESPVPPPAGSARRWPTRSPTSSGTATRTGLRPSCGPPSARCTASGPSRCSRPTGRTRCSRRSASPSAGPVVRSRCSSRPTRCTATSPGSPAPRWSWASAPTTSPSTSPRSTGCSPSRSGHHVPLLAEQPDRPGRAAGGRRGGRSRGRPGLVVVDEAYGQFAPWCALELVDEAVPLVVTRTYSKTWSMAAARLGYLVGPAWLVAELEKVVLPYHLDAVKQAAGPARAALHRRDGGAGRRAGRGAGPAVGGARRPRCRRVAVGRQLRAVPAPVHRRRGGVAGAASTAPCSSATARRGPASKAACGSPSAPAPRTTPSSHALEEIL